MWGVSGSRVRSLWLCLWQALAKASPKIRFCRNATNLIIVIVVSVADMTLQLYLSEGPADAYYLASINSHMANPTLDGKVVSRKPNPVPGNGKYNVIMLDGIDRVVQVCSIIENEGVVLGHHPLLCSHLLYSLPPQDA